MTAKPSLLSGLLRAAFGVVALGGSAMLGGAGLALLLGGPGQPDTNPSSASPSSASPSVEAIAPENPTQGADTPDASAKSVTAKDYMMVAAHPVAAQVGGAVLADGGSAVDAIIAAQMVLNLVEPQSSGIGGGAFLLTWDQKTQTLASYDGRETAPAAGTPDYLLDENGEFKSFSDVIAGGASVGVPGLLRMLEMAHTDQGVMAWKDLFQPAIQLARNGFPVSPRLNSLLQDAKYLNEFEPAASYFYDPETKQPRPIGYQLKNPAFAETLSDIAANGSKAFYEGPLAEAMVAAVTRAPRNPGALSLTDLAGYEAKRRPPVCLHYRNYRVCGMGPPSSGGSTVLEILGILEYAPQDIRREPPPSPEGVRLFGEAMRLAFADRNAYLGDSDFVSVPLEGMLSLPYLQDRASQMDLGDGPKSPVSPGNPTEKRASLSDGLDDTPELPSTSHMVAVDRNGNVATMTSSIEQGFGSRLMVGGFLLNNELTDFAWRSERNGIPAPNRYEPGKRPRSSMAPSLVIGPNGAPKLAIGSPGGSRIIGFVAKTIVAVLDWEMPIQQAIALPHFLNRNGDMELEVSDIAAPLADALREDGYEIKIRPMASGLHGVEFSGGTLIGGADPRREGMAVGEANLNRDLRQVFNNLLASGSD